MSKFDKYILAKMFTFVMRGIFVILNRQAYYVDKLGNEVERRG